MKLVNSKNSISEEQYLELAGLSKGQRRERVDRICLLSSLILSAISLVLLSLGGIVSFAIYVPLAIFAAIILVVSVSLVLCRLCSCRQSKKEEFSPAFLNLLRETYHPKVYDITVKENLSFKELQEIMAWLSSVDTRYSSLSWSSLLKLWHYGVRHFQYIREMGAIDNFEIFLLDHCPFYLLEKSFAESGFLGSYASWIDCFGRLTDSSSLKLLKAIRDKEVYEELVEYAQSDSWEKSEYILRFLRSLSFSEEEIDRQELVKEEENIRSISKLGVNWSAIALILYHDQASEVFNKVYRLSQQRGGVRDFLKTLCLISEQEGLGNLSLMTISEMEMLLEKWANFSIN